MRTNIKRRNSDSPIMESVARFGSIPIVESSIKTAEDVYSRLKASNRLFTWYFDTAEATLSAAVESVLPAVKLLENPIRRLDQVMCKSLDMVEQKVPSVYLPPQLMIYNTKEYMSDTLVRPVVKRADSLKNLGTIVLESPVTNFAANRIDGAISVADKYVDKYLTVPKTSDSAKDSTSDKDNDAGIEDDNEKAALKAIHHGQQFSRKLKRRLTQRTIAEARALKEHSKEAIHILLYAADLIVTDPKQALQKAKELWGYLSDDEPENQERPQTLEQMVVLLMRESARRVVHLVNYVAGAASSVPRSVISSTRELVHYFMYASESLMKVTQLDTAKERTIQEVGQAKKRAGNIYDSVQAYVNNTLERLAIFLSGQIEAEKITTNPRRRFHARTNNPMQNNLNGVY